MKKRIFAVALITITAFAACKGKKSGKNDNTGAAADTENATTKAQITAGTITVTATPDSAVLGKHSELVIKIKNLKALQLSDPDGKVTGTELTYDIEATNKKAMGTGLITIDPSNYRLELDNGTKISNEKYNSFNVDAEATASSTDNTFKLEPGVKPLAMDLFYDETRGVIKLAVK